MWISWIFTEFLLCYWQTLMDINLVLRERMSEHFSICACECEHECMYECVWMYVWAWPCEHCVTCHKVSGRKVVPLACKNFLGCVWNMFWLLDPSLGVWDVEWAWCGSWQLWVIGQYSWSENACQCTQSLSYQMCSQWACVTVPWARRDIPEHQLHPYIGPFWVRSRNSDVCVGILLECKWLVPGLRTA